jgi:hypothetical protein
MTQTSEPGIKSEQAAGDMEALETNDTCLGRAGRRKRHQHQKRQRCRTGARACGSDDERDNLSGIRGSLTDADAARPATAPRPSAWWDELRTQHIAGTGTALLFAGLAPALVMTALWHTAEITPFIFTLTFAIAFGHAVLLGLPLFLVFRSTSWINLTTCVVFGFAVGAAPVGVLTWPMQHPELHTSASVIAVLMIINEAVMAIRWTGYIKPLIYFGSFGALGGLAFWVALIWCGTFESDFFNPSITRLPRNKDGGFGAAARADKLSRGGCAGQNGRKIACVSEQAQ